MFRICYLYWHVQHMLNYCKCLEPKKEIKSNMKRISVYLPLISLYKKSWKPIEKIEHMKQLMHTMMQCDLENTLHKKTQYWNPIAIDILNLFFLQCNKEIPYPKKLSADLRPQNSFTCYHFFTKKIDKLTSSITTFILETCEAIKK